MVKAEHFFRSLGIPSGFMLFGSRVSVVLDNELMNKLEKYGEADYSKLRITLSDTHGVEKLSDDRVKDCFYHEKVHMLLDAMKEVDLSRNEKFVDVLSKLLRQSDESSVFVGGRNVVDVDEQFEILTGSKDRMEVEINTKGDVHSGTKEMVLDIVDIRPGSGSYQSNFLYCDLVGGGGRSCASVDFFLDAYATRSHMISNYADVLRQYIAFNNKLIRK